MAAAGYYLLSRPKVVFTPNTIPIGTSVPVNHGVSGFSPNEQVTLESFFVNPDGSMTSQTTRTITVDSSGKWYEPITVGLDQPAVQRLVATGASGKTASITIRFV